MKTRWFSRLLLITLLLETGIVLIAIPWSTYWERNIFFDLLPGLQAPLQNHFARGAISGIGAVNVCVGLLDLASLILGAIFGLEHRRRSPVPPSATTGQRSRDPDRRRSDQVHEGEALAVGGAVRSSTSDAS